MDKEHGISYEMTEPDIRDSESDGRKRSINQSNGDVVNVYKQDDDDMAYMGKRQQLTRNFGFWSMLGFTTAMMCTWEGVLFSNPTSLVNGGPVGLVYGFIWCFCGVLMTTASLAEMASMLPISGGQYHWVAALAPPKYAKFLSWITGWFSFLGWQAIVASGLYLVATMCQGLIILDNANYGFQSWHSTLFGYAVLALCLLLNTVGATILPKIEGAVLILHILGFFAILIPMLYLSPRSSASFVFTEFDSMFGWENKGISWLVGLSGCIFTFIGFDGPCHMAEEIEKASTIVPWCMISTVLVNGTLGFAMVIAFLFSIGNLEDVLQSATHYDFIQVFYNATNSKAGTSVMTVLIIFMALFASLGCLASASRQTWAFARDNGLPFSRYLKTVSKSNGKPLLAVYLTTFISLLLTLIEIGSTTAFNALISLVIAGLFGSYMLPIILMLIKRVRDPAAIKWGPWRLEKWGVFVNIWAIVFCIISIFFSFWPSMVPVTAQNMNWSVVVYSGAMIFGVAYYFLRARKVYRGPVVDRG